MRLYRLNLAIDDDTLAPAMECEWFTNLAKAKKQRRAYGKSYENDKWGVSRHPGLSIDRIDTSDYTHLGLVLCILMDGPWMESCEEVVETWPERQQRKMGDLMEA